VHIYNLVIIMLQETLCDGKKAWDILVDMVHGWLFCSFDALGISGGIISGWNPRLGNLIGRICDARILNRKLLLCVGKKC
jgi:hypothetical protein